eukprot:998360_1
MPTAPTCAEDIDVIGGVWIEIPLSLIPVILIQIIWLCHTFHAEHMMKKTRNTTPNKFTGYKFQRSILYILLQIIGLCWTINDVFVFIIIDPHTLILRHNIGCYIVAYIPKTVPWIYYILYLYQILLRLEASFKGSPLSISKRTIIIFKVLIIPIAVGPIWFILLNKSTCVRGWKPLDVSSWYERPGPYKFAWCTLQMNGPAVILLIVSLVWGASINIIFGMVFVLKLKVLLSSNVDDHMQTKLDFRYKSLIVKNSILTLTGSISTIAAYIIWIASSFVTGMYIDLLVNCLVIGLMFNYNTKIYKRLCKCCIGMCFDKCDKSKSKLTEEDVVRYVQVA